MNAANDLAAAGFYVAIAAYPLAPPNYIEGQPDHIDPSSGRPPEQTDSVKAFIAAMRNDIVHCDGNVGVLGGSAGGGHAAFVAIDQTYDSAHWPFWDSLVRPNFVACLSGVYDMADRDLDVPLFGFIYPVENYTNTTSRLVQWQESPIGRLNAGTTGIVPIYAIRAEDDSMAASQQYYLFNAFYQNGVSTNLSRMWTIPANFDHAFGYWNDPIKDTSPLQAGWLVKDRVIGYFNYFLKSHNTHF